MQRLCFVVALACVAFAGCHEPASQPRTRDEIFEAKRQVDTLYLTADGQEVIAPGNPRGVVVDPDSGQLAFAAMQCENPDCPGEGNNSRPYLFTKPDPFAYLDDAGNVAYRLPQTEEDQELIIAFSEAGCPACEEIRNRDTEAPEQRQQYRAWVKPYILPESKARLAELDAAYNEIVERNQERRKAIDGAGD